VYGKPSSSKRAGIEGLAGAAAPPFRGVENQVRPEGLDARGQVRGRSSDLDLLDFVAASAQAIRNGVDGFYAVEFCLVLAVSKTEVVGKCDLHAIDAARMGLLSKVYDLNKKQGLPSTDNSRQLGNSDNSGIPTTREFLEHRTG
jgi:hypothetical protein